MIALESGLLSGLNKSVRKRVDRAQIAHVQRSRSSMKGRGAVLLALGFLEVGKHVVITPAGIAQVAPAVIVGGVAANIDHRVDGAAATQNFAARPVQTAIAELRLRIGVIRPVTGSLEELG